MPIISHNEPRLAAAIESAEAAFWADIVANYPEATSGDLSPTETIKLETAMRSAVTEWLMFNADVPVTPQTAEIMLHRIEYIYRGGHDSLLLTDSDKEHIAYCITQGISEGDLCTMLVISPFKEEEVYGYWEINNCPDA